MSAFARMYSRLSVCRHQHADFYVGRNFKCFLQNKILGGRSFTVTTPRDNYGDYGTHQPKKGFVETVLTDKNATIHSRICRMVIGKGGQNIRRLESELGIQPGSINADEPGHILVSAEDMDEVKRAVEIVTLEVQRVKAVFNSTNTEKVLTDEDGTIHSRICKMIIGKGGQNIKRLESELGIPPGSINVNEPGHILVSAEDLDEVKRVVEQMTLEVQRIKAVINNNITEKVLTDEDDEIHSRICRMIIGKGGQNIKRLESELGLKSGSINADEPGHILVSAEDLDDVKRAVEKVTLEVQRVKAVFNVTNTEKVLTDEDGTIHTNICRMIIGKGGQNIKRLESELGIQPGSINVNEPGHILVSAVDIETRKRAVDKMNLEVQRVKAVINNNITEKVLTDEDDEIHSRICRMIIGKGGRNIKRLESELGIQPGSINVNEPGHILVSATDMEVVKRVVEKVKLEVQRAKDIIYSANTEQKY